MQTLGNTVGQWPYRRIGTAIVATTAIALAVGIPTGLVPSAFYTRMTPVPWWNYAIWAPTAVLGGLLVATYIRRPGDRAARSGAGAASGGGLLATLAVGCPVCNKLVVAVLGASGAMTFWAPAQPALGVLSVLGMLWALRRRLKNEYACPTGSAPPGPPAPRTDLLQDPLVPASGSSAALRIVRPGSDPPSR